MKRFCGVSRLCAAIGLALCSFSEACDDSDDDTADAAVDAASGGTGGNAGKGGSGGKGGSSADSGTQECVADFPCFGRTARCVNDHQWRAVRSAPCQEVCGTTSCSGSSCLPTGPVVDCASGETCRDVPTSGALTAQCVADSDAGT